jgi:hypothetical protein
MTSFQQKVEQRVLAGSFTLRLAHDPLTEKP